MKRNDRLSVALHVLLHMAERNGAAMTSAEMAACVETNPVVIRRTFAGLREAGIVTSDKGHGGGWRLARPAADIALADVQRALGESILPLALHEESPGCLVERAVVEAVDGALREAAKVVEARLASLSLADLAHRVQHISAVTGHKLKGA
ncbi:Rrf2 family transcriptional regulator [Bacillus sp. NP157]|nr:Rrf2 family transcriptional regulator [Bacillus sp. NP157]